jgi:hypothetical protein
MSVNSVNLVSNIEMAPEIQEALMAIEKPEVRELMRELSKYNLGVCVPHMHRPDLDFDVLPIDTVQVEEDCRVRWISRASMEPSNDYIPIAWRWTERGAIADVECIQTCSPNPTKGHRSGHL